MAYPARNPRQLGNLIRNARRKRGWSQMQLGDATDLRQATISLLEGGSSSARIDTVLSVLAVLGLELQVGPRTKSDVATIEDIF